jgi:hypothetical protein
MRNGPAVTPGRPDAAPSQNADSRTIARNPDSRGDLRAWGAAVAHLHGLGLPAAVPEFPAAWLARRGLRADWTVAA